MAQQEEFSVKDIVLTLLQASRGSVPVNAIVRVGALMGVSGNAIRVSLSRLVQKGMVVTDDEGNYRISSETSPMQELVQCWRLGEKRRVSWRGNWVICDLPRPAPAQSVRNRSTWALELLGFRRTPTHLWLRPDNLAGGIKTLREKLADLEIESNAELFIGSRFSEQALRHMQTKLWPIKKMSTRYQQLYRRLQKGMIQLNKKPTDTMLVNAFMLGNGVVRTLITDPMLPEEMQDPAPRIRLTNLMLKFDAKGRRIWESAVEGLKLI